MFGLSVDSTFDASRRKQVSFAIGFIDDKLWLIHERAIAIKEYPNTTWKDSFILFVGIME